MFATYEAFKFPVQFDRDCMTWRAVELVLHVPWFLATLKGDDGAKQTFFVERPHDLLALAASSSNPKFARVELVLPPHYGSENRWSLVPISKLERPVECPKDDPQLVIRSTTGVRYSGYPLSINFFEDSDLVPLLEMSDGDEL